MGLSRIYYSRAYKQHDWYVSTLVLLEILKFHLNSKFDFPEHHLFKSLIKVCLIENRESSNYHRCGRTDKGVSAFSQVVSIDIRSKFSPEVQMTEESLANEINYCEALNRVLPANIKCIAWAPLQNALYSAR